jgi:hypothetical protein
MMGDWRQCEVRDGTYDIDDLLDWHEMTAVKRENDRRLREQAGRTR